MFKTLCFSFEFFDVIFMVDKSTGHGKLSRWVFKEPVLVIFTSKSLIILCHLTTGVQSAAVNVICELARKNPKNYLSLAPLFFKLMTSSTNNWMLIKIIKLVSIKVIAVKPWWNKGPRRDWQVLSVGWGFVSSRFFSLFVYYHWGEEYHSLYRGLHYIEVRYIKGPLYVWAQFPPLSQSSLRRDICSGEKHGFISWTAACKLEDSSYVGWLWSMSLQGLKKCLEKKAPLDDSKRILHCRYFCMKNILGIISDLGPFLLDFY